MKKIHVYAGKPLIIWDFDGTLADSFAVVERLLVELAPQYKVAVPTSERIRAWRGMELRGILQELGLKWAQVPGLLLKVQRGMRGELVRIAPVAGLGAVMPGLAAEYRFALTTSNTAENVERWLEMQGWREWFEVIEAGSSLRGKAAHFKKVMKQCGVPARHVVAVGDETRDIEAAKQCGIACVPVAWGFQSAEALRGMGAVAVQKPEDLAGALRDILPR